VTDQIRTHLRAQGLAVIEIGRNLLIVKEHLQHGQFIAWLAAEFRLSERTAQRYMRVAEVFGSKSDTVSYLPMTILHQLAAPSTPAKVREKVIARAKAGKPLTEDRIATLLREARPEKQREPSRTEAAIGDESALREPASSRLQASEHAATADAEAEEHTTEADELREATAKEDQSDGVLQLYIDPKDKEMIRSLPEGRKAKIIVERSADGEGWDGVFATKVRMVEPQSSERRKPSPEAASVKRQNASSRMASGRKSRSLRQR
jgi:hypothetical protein